MSTSFVWNQYFNHYQPRQPEIMKSKLATLNDRRKTWIRDISLCIKLLKCKLIQILKRSLNLRDCLSHFDLKKLILQMSLCFIFISISSVRHPTGSNGRPAKKKDCFSPCEKMISQLSLYLPFAAVSYKRLVTGSGKKKSTFWHNRQFAYALWMSRRWWGSLYVFIEGSFSHRCTACPV